MLGVSGLWLQAESQLPPSAPPHLPRITLSQVLDLAESHSFIHLTNAHQQHVWARSFLDSGDTTGNKTMTLTSWNSQSPRAGILH